MRVTAILLEEIRYFLSHAAGNKVITKEVSNQVKCEVHAATFNAAGELLRSMCTAISSDSIIASQVHCTEDHQYLWNLLNETDANALGITLEVPSE